MDQYGQIGPEKGDYPADVRRVARQLNGATVFARLADRGGQLRLMLTARPDLSAPFGLPDGLDDEGDWVFVAVEDHGAYWLNLLVFNAPDYIAAKLGVAPGDGEIIGEFLTRLRAESVSPPLQEVK